MKSIHSLMCNNCGKEFNLSDKSIRKDLYTFSVSNDEFHCEEPFEVVYFTCPKCGEVFIIQIIDSYIRDFSEMLVKRQDEWNEIIKQDNPELIKSNEKIYTNILALRKKINYELKWLRDVHSEKIKAYLKAKNFI